MPLSDHEQRMLDQIESALYAEDPKFASSVRGGTLRAPSARRRLQGAALFVVGLAMLIAGVAVPGHPDQRSRFCRVIGFIVMFGGVVLATTGPRVPAAKTGQPAEPGAPRAEAAQGLRWVVHQSHGGPLPPSVRRISPRSRPRGSAKGREAAPFLCAHVRRHHAPHTAPPFRAMSL